MNTKNILIIVVVLVLVAGGIYWYSSQEAVVENGARVDLQYVGDEQEMDGKLKAATFSGKLEEVDTGCFADGECYVTVDGKHVTVLMGWSRETVGSVLGVPGFGDLEGRIGAEVEVYAQDKSDGTYTLYGSEGFYVKLK